MKIGRILFAVVAFAVLVGSVVPANAATFLGVELAHQFMNKTFG